MFWPGLCLTILLCFAHSLYHVTPLLRDLHLLRVPQRIEFKLAVLTY